MHFNYREHCARRRSRLHAEQLEDRCLLSTLTVNGSQHFQTIDGFGTNLSSEAWNSGAVTPSLDTLLSHGYKLFRVIVEPVQGWENTNPNTGRYSNANPNWAFYNNLYGPSTKFTNLWNTISYLNNHGAPVWVNLQSDAPAWMTDNGGSTGSIGPTTRLIGPPWSRPWSNYAVNTAHVHIDALGPMNKPNKLGTLSRDRRSARLSTFACSTRWKPSCRGTAWATSRWWVRTHPGGARLSPDMEFDNEIRTPGLRMQYSGVHFLRWVTSRSMTLCRLSQSAGRLRNWLPSRSEITHSLRFGSYITYTSFRRWITPT